MSSPSSLKKPSSSDPSEQILSRLLSLQISPSRLTSTPSYVLCDTPSTFTSAISILENCTSIVVDCEGLNLGVDGGSLSLICIRPTTQASPDIDINYLFDILALTGITSLQPLYTLLTSPEILKIVYDGRMDFCALFHSSPSTTISPVIDLELVDVQSRFLRGETREDQTRRQRRCLPPRQVYDNRNRWKYDKVHVLQGLGMCLVDHGCLGQNPKKDVDHDSWLIRPFTLLHLEYAAHDLVLIDILLSCFISDGYIPSLSPEANAPLLHASQKYIEIWADAPPKPDDRYRSHPLLPLDILSDPGSGEKHICDGCKRNLSVESFPRPIRKASVAHCFICLAMPQWLNLMRIRDEQREKRKIIRENKELREGEATAALFEGANAGRGRGGQSHILPSSPPYSSPNSRGRGRGIVSPSPPLSPSIDSSLRGLRGRGRVGSASRGRGGGGRGGRVSPPSPQLNTFTALPIASPPPKWSPAPAPLSPQSSSSGGGEDLNLVPPSTRGRGTQVGRGRGGQSHIPVGNGRGAGPSSPQFSSLSFRGRGRGYVSPSPPSSPSNESSSRGFRVRGRGAGPASRGRGRGGRGGRMSPPSPQLNASTALPIVPPPPRWSPDPAPGPPSPQSSSSSRGGEAVILRIPGQPITPSHTRGGRGGGGRGRRGESSRGRSARGRGYSRGRGGALVSPTAAGS